MQSRFVATTILAVAALVWVVVGGQATGDVHPNPIPCPFTAGVQVITEPFPHVGWQLEVPHDDWVLAVESETVTVPPTCQYAVVVDTRAEMWRFSGQSDVDVYGELRVAPAGGDETILDSGTAHIAGRSEGIGGAKETFTTGSSVVLGPGEYTFRYYASHQHQSGVTVRIYGTTGGGTIPHGWLRLTVFRLFQEGDFDQDGDVDLTDFGQFQEAFTGPNP